jgi:hypothetical protein
MSEFIEFRLPNKAPQHSGRGVRFELLSPTERDAALVSAAMLAGEDKIKLALLRQREGVKRMLRALFAHALQEHWEAEVAPRAVARELGIPDVDG